MRILIAIDGSSQAEAVLGLAAYLLHNHLADEPPVLLTVARHEADRHQAGVVLTQASQSLNLPNVQGRIRVGYPDKEILHEAEEGRYDLLIMGGGWRQKHPVAPCLHSLTAMRVAEQARCSVFVAKGRIGPIRRILLCDSGARSPLTTSKANVPVLSRFTAGLAELLDGEEEVTVLHVMSQISAGPGVRGKQLRAGEEELIAEHTPEGDLLEQDIQALNRPGIHPRPRIRHGLVVEEILDEARSGDYDLVVIGAHEDNGWRRVLLDDLARKILLQVDRTVLVVR
jgi:nucleotide-binding universal stress UspA family protein